MNVPAVPRPAGRPVRFLAAPLAAEFVDELMDGVLGAAWPAITHDLTLTYLQVGLLMGVPYVLGSVVDPALGVLSDAGGRRALVLSGGVAFALSVTLVALSAGFWPLLLALTVFFPASGAFVTLTETALMDAEPTRREANMARWALAGSAGNTAGPLLVSGAAALSLGWRPVFALVALLTLAALALVWRRRAALGPATPLAAPTGAGVRGALRGLAPLLHRRDVRAALLHLECANLLLDVFRGFLALYIVSADGVTPAQAGVAVAVLTLVGLLGDALAVPLLERVRGVPLVRASAAVTLVVFPAFLLAPTLPLKLGLIGALALLTSGWYAVLQARLYALVPERSGSILTLGAVTGLLGGAVPVALGAVAQAAGIGAALWLLLLGPLTLVLGLPRQKDAG
ncbi:MFS transporter [Deinococcus maricopensis]|uniref:Major facilitator superfamily MFS_1 n=1 Tax=Deinococcus maricopensis (strain DSM 21211 / LMG 22137 / NRRL B-23946 / LB-34) TaxID=709986 RepID=E8UAQ1_DEIML|nr:MFS transporter [Deinococcus maricopensis]ADV68140.1 major facilitator superfamily MFS_1 [Deinococcus maricopensis DSM 21211]